MNIPLNEVKNFGRIYHGDDDVQLISLVNAGIQYLKNATGKEFDDDDDLAKLYVQIWAIARYENRAQDSDVKDTLNMLLTQLQYCDKEVSLWERV